MNGEFENKCVLITGAASGFGRILAEKLSQDGARLVLGDLNDAGLKAVADGLNCEVHFQKCDVSSEAQVKALCELTVQKFGRLDIAFNNAGIATESKPLAELTEADFDLNYAVNAKSVFLGMKHQIPIMQMQGGGKILNTASLAGLVADPVVASYTASKHAVIGLTKAAAVDYRFHFDTRGPTMSTHTRYLLNVDITGYTQFLTSSETDHANPILQSLMGVLLEQIGDPLNFWKTEGDAVLAYSTRQDILFGETFLTIFETIYNAFTQRRQDIITNTTCLCQACANVGKLDLKIIAHYGKFDVMQLGPTKDISGPDVILVHRMTKTDVTERTGIGNYALFSEAAAQAMNISDIIEPFSQDFDHFGEVKMKVYDLAKSWEKMRAGRERDFLEEDDGIWTVRYHFDAPKGVVWEALVAPEYKVKWTAGVTDTRMENPLGRLGPGSGYHCAHAMEDLFFRVTDWEPFEYFSTPMLHPARPEISFPDTYHLKQTDTGTEVRYTIGIPTDADGMRSEVSEQELSAVAEEFWPVSFADLDAQLGASQ